MKVFNILFCWLLLSSTCSATGLSLSRDENGWTQFSASADSRIIYISESGDDDTCTYYLPSSTEVGGDPLLPVGAVATCATYKKAYSLAREGYPDWILFKRGETFTFNSTNATASLYDSEHDITLYWSIIPKNGRSASEPSLTGAYGSSGASPVLQTDHYINQAIRIQRGTPNWIAISGLDFYSYTRDPNNASFSELSTNDYYDQLGLFIYNGNTNTTYYNGFLIEGCKFRFYDDNIVTSTTVAVPDLIIRRNLFTDSYAGNGQSHSQGLYLTKQNITLEENIFVKNGWLVNYGEGWGEATTFNHNVYTSYPEGGNYTNNIFIQGSNMNTKFTASTSHSNTSPILIDDNLYVDGQQGIGFGNNTSGNTHPFLDVTIKDNIFTNIGRQKNIQNIAWYIDLAFDLYGAEIKNNLLMNQADATVNNVTFVFRVAGIQTDISVHDNITYNVLNTQWLYGQAVGDQLSSGSTKTNVAFYNNIYDTTSAGYTVQTNSVDGYTFYSNTYYSDHDENSMFRVNSVNYAPAGWATLTGDDSVFTEPTFPDATRSIETYMASIGETATIDAFIAACRAQDRYNWDSRFNAETVNAWIRAGFFASTAHTWRFPWHVSVQ